jgi:hypothetical protein
MANVMRSTDFRSIVEPILNEEFDGVYEQRKDEWKGPFREQTGTPRSYHEEPVLFGFGAAPEMPDGGAVTYQAGGVLFQKRYQYRVWGLAFALTQVLVEDGDHIRIGQIYAKHLGQSLTETKETLTANVINRSFNASFPGGDGVPLIATNHPIIASGLGAASFSNQLTTAAAMSQTSVEQMLVQIRGAVDNNGKKVRLLPRAITCSPANVFQAETILKSPLRTGTNNNDVNPVLTMGLLKEGQFNMSRLTSNTAWWINTDAPEGLKVMMRRGLKRSMEGDFDTDSMRYKATERYVPGWTDPRTLYGTPGL